MPLEYFHLASPLGPLQLALDAQAHLLHLSVQSSSKSEHLPALSPAQRAVGEEVLAYLEGEIPEILTPPSQSLWQEPNFTAELWRALYQQGPSRGETISYAQLAALGGRAGAARAAGRACALNPVLLAIPCHRVLPASGRLGGFAAGPEIKRRLLHLEGAIPPK